MRDALGISCREHYAYRAPFGAAEYCGALRSGRRHDSGYVIDALLESRHPEPTIRQTLPAFVESDDARKFGEPSQTARIPRNLVKKLYMRNKRWNQQEIDGTVAHG